MRLFFFKTKYFYVFDLEKQKKFQLELNEFSDSFQSNITSSNIVLMLKEYHRGLEQLKYKEEISSENIRLLEEQLSKIKNDEKAQRLKCSFLTKQMKKTK